MIGYHCTVLQNLSQKMHTAKRMKRFILMSSSFAVADSHQQYLPPYTLQGCGPAAIMLQSFVHLMTDGQDPDEDDMLSDLSQTSVPNQTLTRPACT